MISTTGPEKPNDRQGLLSGHCFEAVDGNAAGVKVTVAAGSGGHLFVFLCVGNAGAIRTVIDFAREDGK